MENLQKRWSTHTRATKTHHAGPGEQLLVLLGFPLASARCFDPPFFRTGASVDDAGQQDQDDCQRRRPDRGETSGVDAD